MKENFTEETAESDKINDELEEESDNDSISFLGASDNATAFDVKGKAVDLPIQPSHVDQPSTSSYSSIGGVYRGSLYSLESRTISEACNKINKNRR
ncbi:protein FAR-RED-ELONGATED HYPOCOTYL 1-LIKE [Iris pallida]|uniref:Protein FAR-RED-ELONGATED HYPOCOTYL 1-LIKE n=1 Tax=Iris pallida TaxID=29817 RepID=A0AAX6DQY2_IRIPA|nr:protein FAR-RED-ELONGATED HYPOCOTYL 1-LIKE [Iris pallida]